MTTKIQDFQVEYRPAGAGAVPTTVQDKLREMVSRADFSAGAGGDTDYLNFVKANPLTVPRLDKLRESVSVKDFGAVGDGVTDDTEAISHFL